MEYYYPMGKQPKAVKCCLCFTDAPRDYKADAPRTHSDPDMTDADIDANLAARAQHKQVPNACLARNLGRAPGFQKIVRNGKPFAFFPTKKARREALKNYGVDSD